MPHGKPRRHRRKTEEWTPFQMAQQIQEPSGVWGQMYANNKYTVVVTPLTPRDDVKPAPPPMVKLSIRRNNREPIRDWREMQRIKNELVGANCEGVELYPAEDRLVDTANQYWMWVVTDPTFRFGFGFFDRLVADRDESQGVVSKARQRRFRAGERPDDALTGDEINEKLRTAGYASRIG